MNMEAKECGIFPPKNGWKERTWYLVEVSNFRGNPLHYNLFYSGFLSEKGEPRGYNGGIPINYAPTDAATEIHKYRYIRAISEVLVVDELEKTWSALL